MKKALGFVVSISLLTLFGSSQTIIENSSTPQGKNPGRILELEELMRITDESGEFYFKRPFRLSLDDDGFIYFQDDDGIYSVVKYRMLNGPSIVR